MNEIAIRELKAMLGRLYEKADPDDPDRKSISDFIDEMDHELIEKSKNDSV